MPVPIRLSLVTHKEMMLTCPLWDVSCLCRLLHQDSLLTQCSSVNGSSATTSLTQAFMAIHLNTTLTGLTSKLLNYANLTVLPTTGVSSDMVCSRGLIACLIHSAH